MINKRELRITLFYFSLIAIMIFEIYLIKITGFVHKGPETMIVILMAFLFLAPIFCFIALIYHLIKVFNFPEKIEDKSQNIIWEYDKCLWRSFIITYFKTSTADDAKSLGKFGIKFIPISLLGIIIAISLNPNMSEYPLVYVSIPFVIFLVYFLWVMGRNILKILDHLIFSDYKVVLMKNGAIFNGEYINWDIKGESKLIEKKIIDGCIDIKYYVRARSNSGYQDLKDIKRLKVPIPAKRFNEAESFLYDECKTQKVYRHQLKRYPKKEMLKNKIKSRNNSKKVHRNYRIIRIFVLIQTVILISSFFIRILSHRTDIRFYTLIILFTFMSIMAFEMVLLFTYNLVKSQRIKDKVFAIGMICLFTLVGGFLTLGTIKYYKDVPYVIKREYSLMVGECTHVYANYGRGSHLDITVGNTEFNISLEYKKSIEKGKFYKIYYLPNTKEVVDIWQ